MAGEADASTASEANVCRNLIIGIVLVVGQCILYGSIFAAEEGRGLQKDVTNTWPSFGVAYNNGMLWNWLLALVIFVPQGLGKIANPLPYFDDVAAFQTLPGPLLGCFYIFMELFMAPAIIMGALYASTHWIVEIGIILAWVDIIGYTTLSTQGYLRGLAYAWNFQDLRSDGKSIKNCTCFGIYGAQKLTVWVLLQDLIILIETWVIASRFYCLKNLDCGSQQQGESFLVIT